MYYIQFLIDEQKNDILDKMVFFLNLFLFLRKVCFNNM